MAIRTIDCHYLDAPEVAAAYLLHDGHEAAFVDNNTARALPHLLGALEGEGLLPQDVAHLIVTHVHLDHAGGTWALAAACPNAVVLCHPRAARHLVDPAKLVASARTVYGDDAFEHLYGQIDPIDPSRVRTVDDGEVTMLGTRGLRFLHTRGHANHHLCVFDEREGAVLTGDAFGLAYPALQRAGLYVFPSTSPTDFDANEACRSVWRILDTGARTVHLAHFGVLDDLERAASQLTAQIEESEAIVAAAAASSAPDAELSAWCRARVDDLFRDALARVGLDPAPHEWAFLALDRELNGDGLAHVARKRRSPG